jgi:hypothetical protein
MTVAGLKAECNVKLYVILQSHFTKCLPPHISGHCIQSRRRSQPHFACPHVQLALQLQQHGCTGCWQASGQLSTRPLNPPPVPPRKNRSWPTSSFGGSEEKKHFSPLTPTRNQTADRPARSLETIRTPSLEIRSNIWVVTGPSFSHISWDVACRFEDRTHAACRLHGRYTL